MSPIIRINNGALRLSSGKLAVPAAAGPLAPPPTPVHWFDNDTSTWYEDSGGADPAEDFDSVISLDNKGTNGTRLVDGSGNSPVANFTGGPNNLPYLDSNGTRGIQNLAWAGTLALASGFCFAGTFLRNGIANGTGLGYANFEFRINPSADWQITPFNGGTPISTGFSSNTNEWYWWYVSVETDGTVTYNISGLGGGEVSTDQGVYAAFTPTERVDWIHGSLGQIQGTEWIMWDRPLLGSERTDLVTYFDTKYGVLPA